MKPPRCLPPWAVLLFWAAAHLPAQTVSADWNTVTALPAETAVRIKTGSRTVSGRIDRVTGDAVVVDAGARQETFDHAQVSAVWVKKPGHRGRNALIGLAVGAAAGLGIGVAERGKPGQLEVVPGGAIVATGTVAGAIVGTVVGVAIPTGGWRKIYGK